MNKVRKGREREQGEKVELKRKLMMENGENAKKKMMVNNIEGMKNE
jgi:hypothetical protein